MDCAVGFIADDGGIDDDEGGMRKDQSFGEEIADDIADKNFPFLAFKGKAAGAYAIVQCQLASEGNGGGEGIDGGNFWAQGGGDSGHSSRTGEKKNALGFKLVGKMDSCGDDSIGLSLGVNAFFVANGARAFDTAGNSVEDFEAGSWILSGGGLP